MQLLYFFLFCASFPLSLGEYTEQGKLSGRDFAGYSPRQGYSVALSGEGDVLAVGAPYDSTNYTGAVWIFDRDYFDLSWSQRGQKLVEPSGPDPLSSALSTSSSSFPRPTGLPKSSPSSLSLPTGLPNSFFGISVAMPSDWYGEVVVIGAPTNYSRGCVWVFWWNGTNWWYDYPPLVGSNSSVIAGQGTSVAVSSDGDIIASGAPLDVLKRGAVWVFGPEGDVKLVPSDSGPGSGVGQSVALSSFGDILAVGGCYDGNSVGAAWIFAKIGTWTQQGPKLVGSGSVLVSGAVYQGWSVALSGNGQTLAVGGPKDNGTIGAVWIWVQTNGTTQNGTTPQNWTQATKLVGSSGTSEQFGSSVVFAQAHDTLAIGARYTPDDQTGMKRGAVYIFKKSSDQLNWPLLGDRIVGSGSDYCEQGFSVAFSYDGDYLATGGPYDNGATGAAWVFSTDDSWNFTILEMAIFFVGCLFVCGVCIGFGFAVRLWMRKRQNRELQMQQERLLVQADVRYIV